MKRLPITLTVLSLAAISLLGVVSCQKEKTEEKPIVQQDPEAQRALERISEFKNQIEYYKSHPDTREASSISVDDAVWDLEALFNYTYAYPELCYGRTMIIDTTLSLAISSNDSVLMSDLATFYNQMFATISAIYQSVTLPDKHFIVLDVEEGDLRGNQVEIILHTAQGSAREPLTSGRDPFNPGEWWYYGENMGGSDSIGGDAAQMLTWWLNIELTPVPPEGSHYVYSRVTLRTSTTPSDYPYVNNVYNVPDQYCEFEVIGDPTVNDTSLVLNADQLNFHYHGELELIRNLLDPSGQLVSLTPFSALVISDSQQNPDKSYQSISHHTTAMYGIPILCLNNQHERGNLEP